MEMVLLVRSLQNLASSSMSRHLKPGNSLANYLIFSLVQLSTDLGHFLITSFTPSSLGLNSSSLPLSINVLIIAHL